MMLSLEEAIDKIHIPNKKTGLTKQGGYDPVPFLSLYSINLCVLA